MEVLAYLAKNSDRVVSNDELLDFVWKGHALGDNPVYKSIGKLRKALGDDVHNPTFIKTVSKKGYKLLKSVNYPQDKIKETISGLNKKIPRPLWHIILSTSIALITIVGFGIRYIDFGNSSATSLSIAETEQKSIVIFPFKNLSDKEEDSYFGYGMAEEIQNQLVQIPELKVIATTSTKNLQDWDIKQITKELGVNYIVHGSVRRDLNTRRITARLLDKHSVQLWSDTFDVTGNNIFKIQDQIAQNITKAMAIKTKTGWSRKITHTNNEVAYEYYLIAQDAHRRRIKDWILKASQLYQQALELDADFAAAHAGLAHMLLYRAFFINEDPELAKPHIDRALEIDPNLAEAHAALGRYYKISGKTNDSSTNEKAMRSYRKAIQLKPDYIYAYTWLGNGLLDEGKVKQAHEIKQAALQYDPLDTVLNGNYAISLSRMGEKEQALARLQRVLSFPNPPEYQYGTLSQLYLIWGDLEASHKVLTDYVKNSPAMKKWINVNIGLSYGQFGLFEQGIELFDASEVEIGSHKWFYEHKFSWLLMQNRAQEAEQLLKTRIEQMGQTINPSLPINLLEMISTARLILGDYNSVINLLAPVFMDNSIIFDGIGGSKDAAFAAQHLAVAYQKTGQADKASEILSRLEKELLHREQQGFLKDPFWLSTLARNLVIQNRHDEALSRLSKAINLGWRSFYQIQYDSVWEPIRQDPEFQKLMLLVKSDIERQRQSLLLSEKL